MPSPPVPAPHPGARLLWRIGLVLGLLLLGLGARDAAAGWRELGLDGGRSGGAGPTGARSTGAGRIAEGEARRAGDQPTETGSGGPPTGRWQTFANGDRINRVLRGEGVVWTATDGGGVLRWDLAGGGYRQFLSPQDGLPDNRVHDLAFGADGSLWAATGRGLARLAPGTERWSVITPAGSPDMPSRVVTALEPTADGRLWVGFAQEWDRDLAHPRSGAPGAFRPGGLARFDPASGAWDEIAHAEATGSGLDEDYKTIPSENVTELTLGADGILWIGTRPFFVWDPNACDDPDCGAEDGYWVLAGGGLAARQGERWTRWLSSQTAASCFGSTISQIAGDSAGRMWVGTVGHGLLVMRNGMNKVGCNNGQAYYTRPRRAGQSGGMRGNSVWSVAVDASDRVWIGHGEGQQVGQGIAILEHNNTFDDSSACDCSRPSDDLWTLVDLDGAPGESDGLVTALEVKGPGPRLVGTRDHRYGDGFGLRAYREAEDLWNAYRSADQGLPSNHIADLAYNPATGELWVSTRRRGVARFDGQAWRGWRMFGPGARVASVTATTRAGFARVPVDFANAEAFGHAFPVLPAMARIGDDPVFYRVRRFIPQSGGVGPFIEVSPDLGRTAEAGAAIALVERGPASDAATQLAVATDGSVWTAGRETVWMGADCPSDRAAVNECWLDGGIARWDGRQWIGFDEVNSAIPDQEVQSLAIDRRGRIWAGTGNGASEGNGIGILDPATGEWTRYDRALPAGARPGSNGIADLASDPLTGAMWMVHHAVIEYRQNLGGGWDRVYAGGGVSRWDAAGWRTWAKPSASLKAFGAGGDLRSVLVDRRNARIWAGGWVDQPEFHWLLGYGLDAVVNWCPLDRCGDGDWQSQVWPEDGSVDALAQDHRGRVWVGTNRHGVGMIPPRGGVKVWDGAAWHRLGPEDSGLVDREASALAAAGEAMWVGSWDSGLSHFLDMPVPTETPTDPPSPTARASATESPAATATPSPSASASATLRPSASATPTPIGRCQAGRPCRLYLPDLQRQPACLDCASPSPSRPAGTAPATATRPGATAPASPSPRASATPSASPEPSASPLPPTLTPTPSITPTASTTPSPTASPTATRLPATATPSASPTPKMAPLGSWSLYTPAPGERLPNVDLFDVHGSAPDNVWLVGAAGTALFWDGQELLVETLPTTEDLQSVHMLDARRGFIVASGGTVFEMRSGRWRRADTGSILDNWQAVHVIDTAEGPRGWVLGNDRGNRLYFDGSRFAATSPDDRNTNHKYSGVAMLGPSLAYAIQTGVGGRVFRWDGRSWLPGPSPGPMFDLHLLSPTEGAMVGERGEVWRLGTSETWSAMTQKPVTRGATLNTVWMLGPDRIFTGGDQTGLFIWDGAAWQSQTVRAQGKNVQGIWTSADGREGWGVGTGGMILRYTAP